jgi:ribosomal-protein-alanine N-acetyltransferase
MDDIAPPRLIQTPRLIMRAAKVKDAPPIFERYNQDVEVARYLTWQPVHAIDETITFLRRCEARWQSGEAFSWVLTPKQGGGPIGMVELRVSGHGVELAYVLARAYWNYGYMTEAARAIIDWALEQSSIYRVWAMCDVENAASIRVLEKLGMLREGILRRFVIHPNMSSEPRDCYCYSIVK